jgi:hypothetical protein
MSDVIVNVSVGSSNPIGQARMGRSLDRWAPDIPRIFWDRWPGKPHSECPYGFKVDAFDQAVQQSYDRALWLDSHVIAVNHLSPVWAWLNESPVLQLEDNWTVGEWTSDHALSMFGITRDAAMTMPMSWAKVVGIDLRHSKGIAFLDRWRRLRDKGAFEGPWRRDSCGVPSDPRYLGHRHDQSCASWLAYDMGIKMAPKAIFISTFPNETGPVFVARGNTQ